MFPVSFTRLIEVPECLGRVIAQERGAYVIATLSGECLAELDGKLRRLGAGDHLAFPIVGDYLAIELRDAASATIRRVLPRVNVFARRAAGSSGMLQPIAANLDTLFIVVAVNGDFNLRRIERYLVAASAYGVPVALALSKSISSRSGTVRRRCAQRCRPDAGRHGQCLRARWPGWVDALPGQGADDRVRWIERRRQVDDRQRAARRRAACDRRDPATTNAGATRRPVGR